jgi:DNA-binding NtrC family response regulator
MLTDVMLTDGDGIESARARGLSAHAGDHPFGAEHARYGRAGQRHRRFRIFPQAVRPEELVRTVRQAVGSSEGGDLPDAAEDLGQGLPLVGRSPAMQAVYRMITRVLRNDLTVLILGESGTGKELVAEAIHQLGNRREGPFVAVNTAAIPHELIESELFGHEKALSPAPWRARSASSSRPRAAPCFSTKSATCRSRRKPACCALQSGVSAASAGPRKSRSIAGSSRPPTAIWCR